MQRVRPAYVCDETLSPLEQEGQVLQYFRENFTENPKKLKKLAQYLEPLVPAHARRGVVTSVLAVRDPVRFLKGAFKEIMDIPIIMQGLRDDGNHGMIMDEAKIYGFEIKTNPKWLARNDLSTWTMEDEIEIANSCVEEFMESRLLKAFRGKILLFKEFGFSGMPRMVDQEFSKEYYEKLILKTI